jgi:hypothetical protein
MPWVATDDIAWLAAKELANPRGRHRVYLEVGSEEVSMNELAVIIGKEIGRPVEYRYIETTRKDVEAEFLARFGTLEKWQDDTLSADALNSGIVKFHGEHEYRPKLPTTMEVFIGDVWKPRYLESVREGDERETFAMWTAKD